MLNRWIEDGLLDTLRALGVGCIGFSPLAQDLLTGKCLNGTPDEAHAGADGSFSDCMLSGENLGQTRSPNESRRGRSFMQMAIA
ncbi:hypothetical protein [Parvularcula dongshanensis]|uniref:Aryl-alcohol dehydrogenase-like predicted oxidoreductase n=1 Tax=Parvularcula dongshanensis TaxID=1173995 RepID=A0A840I5Y5_9PROT|nr:aryl-alcohol dehydrogenase-like predicted oxidoreductase [Parvularcula dongshanensis]